MTWVKGARDDAAVGIERLLEFIIEELYYVDAKGPVRVTCLKLLLQLDVPTGILVQSLNFLLSGGLCMREVCHEKVDEAGHVSEEVRQHELDKRFDVHLEFLSL